MFVPYFEIMKRFTVRRIRKKEQIGQENIGTLWKFCIIRKISILTHTIYLILFYLEKTFAGVYLGPIMLDFSSYKSTQVSNKIV
jgi:hypothetical protein